MSAPRFTTLTQWPVAIEMSRPAMIYVLEALRAHHFAPFPADVLGDVENFKNFLHNLLERSEPDKPDNLDLI